VVLRVLLPLLASFADPQPRMLPTATRCERLCGVREQPTRNSGVSHAHSPDGRVPADADARRVPGVLAVSEERPEP
jgi:hypothetical protein